MRKVTLNQLSADVQSFLKHLPRGESVVIEDDTGRIWCGITPYVEPTPAQRRRAWQHIEELQQRVGKSMKKHGVTEQDVMNELLKDD